MTENTVKHRLLPEWAPLDAVLLAWPHENTDWQPWLAEVEATYLSLIDAINQTGAGVILLVPANLCAQVQAKLSAQANVMLLNAEYNDTWLRDYGFLTCELLGDAANQDGGHQPIEFQFNGWGNKFDARRDNAINQRYLAALLRKPIITYSLVAEGGALEIDADGHLLSTSQCLLNPERNGDLTLESYQAQFTQALGCSKVTIFTEGHLEGDDTDGHIDTLVRFTPQQALVIQAADNRPQDPHFAGLSALCQQCQQALPNHQQFRLPLPAMYNAEGERLPASYANYLICNQHVLVPTYRQPEDAAALAIIQQAYPQFTLIAIDCAPLIQQFGSLHCISMQVPTDTLRPNIVAQLAQGVTVYAPE